VIGSENIPFILPVIHEWNQKVKNGDTTRLSSLIALKYYQWTIEKGVYLSSEDGKQDLLHTITHGAVMIKCELEGILNEVTTNRWNNPRDPYFDLMKVILTDVDAFPVWMSSPEYVLQVADQFWYRSPRKDGGSRRRMDIEDEFCLRRSHHN
jgi:hypothetical protein